MSMGKKRAFCPYYMTKELKRDADIIFMPYNYLLDPKTRKANGVELAVGVMFIAVFYSFPSCILQDLSYACIVLLYK